MAYSKDISYMFYDKFIQYWASRYPQISYEIFLNMTELDWVVTLKINIK